MKSTSGGTGTGNMQPPKPRLATPALLSKSSMASEKQLKLTKKSSAHVRRTPDKMLGKPTLTSSSSKEDQKRTDIDEDTQKQEVRSVNV